MIQTLPLNLHGILAIDIVRFVDLAQWPKGLNAPLEEVDPQIADIIELEKSRQWKVRLGGAMPLLCRNEIPWATYRLRSPSSCSSTTGT